MKIKYEITRGYHPAIIEHFGNNTVLHCVNAYHNVFADGEHIGETFQTSKESHLGNGWSAIKNGIIIGSGLKTRKAAAEKLYKEESHCQPKPSPIA